MKKKREELAAVAEETGIDRKRFLAEFSGEENTAEDKAPRGRTRRSAQATARRISSSGLRKC